MVKPLSLGMIGYSPGNGHPFSFSAIVNGYDGTPMREAGWTVIADYLDRQSPYDIGIAGAQVTCCWAEDPDIANQIARACRTRAVDTPQAMLSAGLDAVIVARDDWESHFQLAMPFLEAGISVFVDKPLTLDRDELARFTPHLESGRLMSCSALRYARELDGLRARPESIGTLQAVNGVVPLSMSRYGIHMIEAIGGVWPKQMEPVSAFAANGCSHALLRTQDGAGVTIQALGQTAKRFRLSFYGDQGGVEVDIADNFSAFRRCILHFLDQVRTGIPAIDPAETLSIMHLVMAIDGLTGEGRA